MMRMASCFCFFLTCIVGNLSYANWISDLYYVPSKGDFFGMTGMSFSSMELQMDPAILNLRMENSQSVFVQRFGFGITDRVSVSLEMPITVAGKSTIKSGSASTSNDLDSESQGPVFTGSFLVLDSDDRKGTRLGLDLNIKPKAMSKDKNGYLGFNIKLAGNISESTKWMLSSRYTYFVRTEVLEAYSLHETSVSIQSYFNESFFVIPKIYLNVESASETRDGSIEIHYVPRLGLGLSLGGLISGENLMWMLTAQSEKGTAEYYQSGAEIETDILAMQYSLGIGYKF